MKRFCGCLILVLLWGLPARAEVPRELAGFVLGGHISQVKDRIRMETALPERYQPFIHEAEIREMGAFKSGLITFGNCAAPGRIVRIRLKYEDSSRKFYEELLRRFKERFGDPDEWRGDPFGIVLAWKWSFTDREGNRISLILQHNSRDEEERIGNAVKFTMTNLIEEERLCFEKKQAPPPPKAPGTQAPDWNLLVPR